MCSNIIGVGLFSEKVSTVYPEIHNYENAVEEDQYFSLTRTLLNNNGASALKL
jgi:hypothetical protein